ncbi:MAG: type II toxin-antitoxin system VapC family toxin [Deltaproteobacteria bacterium]|nr:type II toxin-antitoxin system VapC family toxin [Deltaproteobacteria bacterium]
MIRRAVLDASAAVELVLAGSRASAVLDVLDECLLVLVPGLFYSEVANALWKYARSGELSAEEAASLLDLGFGLPDRVIPDRELAAEALGEAMSADHPVYDLLYACLARRFGCTVVTLDGRLAKLLGEMGVPYWRPEAKS